MRYKVTIDENYVVTQRCVYYDVEADSPDEAIEETDHLVPDREDEVNFYYLEREDAKVEEA